MKAVLFHKYGSPDVLSLQDVDKPTPQEDQVLIKIHACGTNPLDWHRMRADPILVRLGDGLFKPKDPRLGADIAGTVEAVGSAVSTLRPGDEVYGDIGAGGFAEYVCAREKAVVPKPANLSWTEAAAVPVAALTALQGLRDTGKIQAGQKVLVNGASGGVGTFAVQMAKAFGAEVTGVCSARNRDLVLGIGADTVVDYAQTDFTRTDQRYDLILDAIGNRSVRDLRRALTPRGIGAVAGFTTLGGLLQILLQGSWGGQSVATYMAKPNQADLQIISELLASDKVKPVLDRTFPLAKTAEAIRYLETARARGKVVITMD